MRTVQKKNYLKARGFKYTIKQRWRYHSLVNNGFDKYAILFSLQQITEILHGIEACKKSSGSCKDISAKQIRQESITLTKSN